jgi:hypothetical protein
MMFRWMRLSFRANRCRNPYCGNTIIMTGYNHDTDPFMGIRLSLLKRYHMFSQPKRLRTPDLSDRYSLLITARLIIIAFGT